MSATDELLKDKALRILAMQLHTSHEVAQAMALLYERQATVSLRLLSQAERIGVITDLLQRQSDEVDTDFGKDLQYLHDETGTVLVESAVDPAVLEQGLPVSSQEVCMYYLFYGKEKVPTVRHLVQLSLSRLNIQRLGKFFPHLLPLDPDEAEAAALRMEAFAPLDKQMSVLTRGPDSLLSIATIVLNHLDHSSDKGILLKCEPSLILDVMLEFKAGPNLQQCITTCQQKLERAALQSSAPPEQHEPHEEHEPHEAGPRQSAPRRMRRVAPTYEGKGKEVDEDQLRAYMPPGGAGGSAAE